MTSPELDDTQPLRIPDFIEHFIHEHDGTVTTIPEAARAIANMSPFQAESIRVQIFTSYSKHFVGDETVKTVTLDVDEVEGSSGAM